MGQIAKYGSTIIVLINTLFLMIGVVFLAGGLVVKFFPNLIDTGGEQLMKMLKEKLPDQAKKFVEDVKISELIGEAATAFIVVGVVLLGLVVWAYCGTCCKSRMMLIIYAGILTAIILGEVTVAVLFTTKREMFDDKIKESLKTSLSKFYEGSASKSAISRLWNAIMGLLKCCGVDGPDDFLATGAWNHQVPSSYSTPHPVSTLKTPIICASNMESVPSLVASNRVNDILYRENGCYAAIWNVIEKNKNIAIGAAAGVGAFQALLLLLTICIIKDMWPTKKNKVSPGND